MIKHFSDLKIDTLKIKKVEKGKGKKKSEHCNNIFTFDIETTSFFIKENIIFPFDFCKPPSFYTDCEKKSFCYIWQFSIDEKIFYGRDLKEFKILLDNLIQKIDCKFYIFVHNLSFEFQFLLNVLDTELIEVFSRKKRKVIYFKYSDVIEFRCTYFLTNLSLENVGKFITRQTQKSGDLDYYKMRHSKTALTEKELTYCEIDCIIIYELILLELKTYENVYNIPYTQTGKVRRELKKRYKNKPFYYEKLNKMVPRDFEDFHNLTKCFAGGYVHSSKIHTNKTIRNVKSFDKKSSYPYSMLSEKYPMTKFIKYLLHDIEKMDIEKNAYMVKIEFNNLRSKSPLNYLSKSKAEMIFNCLEDNGRIEKCEKSIFWLTEIDIEIVKDCYDFSYNILDCYISRKDYLDKTFYNFILELYENKTKLKNIKECEELYMTSKEFLNSLYGMCVTNTIKDDVTFSGKWDIEILSEENADELLKEQIKKRIIFLNYAWGVWVTAYSRRNLFFVINQLKNYVAYSDTDSVKVIENEYTEKVIENYNNLVRKKLEKAGTYTGTDFARYEPVDSKGKKHLIGTFEYEKTYDFFRTLGAKKYCHVSDDDINIVLSGVNKKSGATALNSVDDFKDGFTFDYEKSGRSILTYHENDDIESYELVDFKGEKDIVKFTHGINFMKTTYTLSRSIDYQDFLNTTEKLSILEKR